MKPNVEVLVKHREVELLLDRHGLILQLGYRPTTLGKQVGGVTDA